MKALSLLQPWASLVVIGRKTIETRSWSTRHRGELLIHASTGRSGALLAAESPFVELLPPFDQLPRGALIGKVVLKDVVSLSELNLSDGTINLLTLEERAFGDYRPGRYAWLLEQPLRFRQPIPVKGGLGVWDYSGALPPDPG